jgi:hypothetical protein
LYLQPRDRKSTSIKLVTTQKLNQGKKSGNWIHQLAYQKQFLNTKWSDGKKKKGWKPLASKK